MFCTGVHLQIMFDQPDYALEVIGRAPRGGGTLNVVSEELWTPKPSFPSDSISASPPPLGSSPPGGDVLQGLLLLILLGEPGQLQEELVHLLDGKEALGSWGERLALLKEDSDCL